MKVSNVLKSIGIAIMYLILTFSIAVAAEVSDIEKIHYDNVKTIEYQGQTIVLSDQALYVNTQLEEESEFQFKTLQSAIAAAKPGKKGKPTVIYLEPDVYWTDDYTNPEIRQSNDLIGLIIPQPYITLVGMTGDPKDVVIASDRGQNAGANGNFNTIGVGDGFHAKVLPLETIAMWI